MNEFLLNSSPPLSYNPVMLTPPFTKGFRSDLIWVSDFGHLKSWSHSLGDLSGQAQSSCRTFLTVYGDLATCFPSYVMLMVRES